MSGGMSKTPISPLSLMYIASLEQWREKKGVNVRGSFRRDE
jgi:hypothetical protein